VFDQDRMRTLAQHVGDDLRVGRDPPLPLRARSGGSPDPPVALDMNLRAFPAVAARLGIDRGSTADQTTVLRRNAAIVIRILARHVEQTDIVSGVEPLALQLLFGPAARGLSVGATTFDPATGIVAFSIPREAFPIDSGPQFMRIVASDFQESKNINTESDSPLPNTKIQGLRAEAVNGPTITWITPEQGRCLAPRQKLLVVANDTVAISSVGFFDGNREIGRVRKNVAGLYEMTWGTSGKRKGAHVLTATVSDVRGREAEARRTGRICG